MLSIYFSNKLFNSCSSSISRKISSVSLLTNVFPSVVLLKCFSLLWYMQGQQTIVFFYKLWWGLLPYGSKQSFFFYLKVTLKCLPPLVHVAICKCCMFFGGFGSVHIFKLCFIYLSDCRFKTRRFENRSN